MNQKDRQEYSALSIRQQRRIEGRHMRPIYQALRITVDNFIADAKARGLTAATSALHTVVSNPALAEELQATHQDAGLFFGRKSWREIQRSARQPIEKAGFGLNAKWIVDIVNHFTRDLFALVQNITATTRQQILDILTKAQQKGESFEWIVNNLNSPELLKWRTRLIARTETAKGAFVGRQLANQDSEWETEKEWISANDHRTRSGHRKVDGEIIDADARYQVTHPKGFDMMIGPGDPSASAANLCNCRCASAVRAKRDKDGRLIRKTTTVQITTNI